MGKLYKINEIFGPTIQGEGTHVGKKVSFIRFSGCNLKCEFCDTKHDQHVEMSIKDILNAIPNNTEILVLTGGEPLVQIDEVLIYNLKEFQLHLETNGTIDFNYKKLFNHISVSPKLSVDKTQLKIANDLKLVFPKYNPDDWEDYLCENLFLQPLEINGERAIEKTLVEIYKRKNWRLSVQLHKFIGVK